MDRRRSKEPPASETDGRASSLSIHLPLESASPAPQCLPTWAQAGSGPFPIDTLSSGRYPLPPVNNSSYNDITDLSGFLPDLHPKIQDDDALTRFDRGIAERALKVPSIFDQPEGSSAVIRYNHGIMDLGDRGMASVPNRTSSDITSFPSSEGPGRRAPSYSAGPSYSPGSGNTVTSQPQTSHYKTLRPRAAMSFREELQEVKDDLGIPPTRDVSRETSPDLRREEYLLSPLKGHKPARPSGLPDFWERGQESPARTVIPISGPVSSGLLSAEDVSYLFEK